MAFQNLKTVVTLGGNVDSSFSKIGSAFADSMAKASSNVKALEKDQKALTRAIDSSKKASAELAALEQQQSDGAKALDELKTSHSGLNVEIRKQRRQLKQLDEERSQYSADEVEALAEVNRKYAALDDQIHKNVITRDKLTNEIKSGTKAQTDFAKKAETIKKNIKDVDSLEKSYSELGHEIGKATIEAENFKKAADFGDKLKRVSRSALTMVGSVWASTTAVSGLMTVTNTATASMFGMAESYDMSIESFKAWDGVAQKAGLTGEHVGDLIEELSNKFGEFKALGDQSAVSDVFGSLGIEESMMDGMAAAEQFEFIMGRIAQVEDKQQAASLADMLFGGEGNKLAMYMRNTGKSLHELLDEQRQYNLLTEKGTKGAVAYNDSFKNLSGAVTSSWSEISGIVGGEMAGEMNTLGQSFSAFFKDNKDDFVSFFSGVVDVAKFFVKTLWTVGSAINTVAQAFGGWKNIAIAVGSIMAAKMIVNFATMAITGIKLAKAFGVMKVAMAAFNVVAAMNPIGLIVAGVSGLVFLAVKLYQNWEPVLEWFSNKLSSIGDLFSSIPFFGNDTSVKVDSNQTIKQVGEASRAANAIQSSAPRGGGGNLQQSIVVNAAPGQSAEEVANAVYTKAGKGTALYDLAEAW